MTPSGNFGAVVDGTTYVVLSAEMPSAMVNSLIDGSLLRTNLLSIGDVMRRLATHTLATLLLVAISIPLAAQQNGLPATPPAMPAKLAPTGPVTPNPVWEKKFQDEVKTLD